MQGGATVELDGSEGEGGGQILRSALSLSLITGRPFHLVNLRARRRPSGLRPQHLACVRGAVAISGAKAVGAQVDSLELWFNPAPVRAGPMVIEVGTAGSTPLILQCLLYPLALAGGGELTLRGGTHVPQSPSYHYLAGTWLPALDRYGLGAKLSLIHAGFFPKGAGEVVAQIPAPRAAAAAVELCSRGALREVDVSSMVCNLPFEIAERQARSALECLREKGIAARAHNLPLPTLGSTGTVVFIRAEFENSIAGFTALGQRGKRAEVVGREAALELTVFLESAGAVDLHLGDQLLLPAGLLAAGRLGGSSAGLTRFRPQEITSHLSTNARVLERFLPVRVTEQGGLVEVRPA